MKIEQVSSIFKESGCLTSSKGKLKTGSFLIKMGLGQRNYLHKQVLVPISVWLIKFMMLLELILQISNLSPRIQELNRPTSKKVKNHLFYNEHLLDRYVDYGIPAKMSRFDSDISIANAWKRLEAGNFTHQDMQLLRHETAEAWYMRRNGPGYSAAHNTADKRYPAPRYDEKITNTYSNNF